MPIFTSLPVTRLMGPSGIGVLYGKAEHLNAMPPYQGGGEMILDVFENDVTYAAPPHRFEAGTPAIVQAIGLGSALEYMMEIGRDNITAHELKLLDYANERLAGVNSLKIIGQGQRKKRHHLVRNGGRPCP